jgi:hypothetical protein
VLAERIGWPLATFLARRLFLRALRLERQAAHLYDWTSSRKANAWLEANIYDDPEADRAG